MGNPYDTSNDWDKVIDGIKTPTYEATKPLIPKNDDGIPIPATWKDAIWMATNEMRQFLLDKNDAYGNSIFEPVRIYSKADVLEQINVRIDDKLSRLMRGKEYAGDDTLKDLAGYYLLKRAYMLKLGLVAE